MVFSFTPGSFLGTGEDGHHCKEGHREEGEADCLHGKLSGLGFI
jgi:hypothetical protein